MGSTKIVFASDHAALEFKKALMSSATEKGCEVINSGPVTTEPVDYPAVVNEALDLFHSSRADFIVLLCGSGIGVSIAANRDPKIRGFEALETEQAKIGRAHV